MSSGVAEETRVLGVSGFLGYGFPEQSFEDAVARRPQFIVCDAGTNDAGPYYLGAGASIASYAACKRDLSLMMVAGAALGAPVIIGSAWTSGSDAGVDLMVSMAQEIAGEHGLAPRIAAVYSEQSPKAMEAMRAAGRIVALPGQPDMLPGVMEESTRIVCAMGAEPIVAALQKGADVVIAGRASDAAIYAAGPLARGAAPERAWHAGRILECGACAADPGDSADCLFATVTNADVILEPTNAELRCTPSSVAAHAMYETSSCLEAREPSGLLVLENAVYEAATDRSVRISGHVEFKTDVTYSMRVEGALHRGYRAISVGGIRDPRLVQDIHTALPLIEQDVRRRIEIMGMPGYEGSLMRLILYGLNGVLGSREPHTVAMGHELALVIDVVAKTQKLADDILALARAYVLHADFPGRLNANAGNLAFPFSPSDVPLGEVYEYLPGCVVLPDTPVSLIRSEFHEISS